MDKFAELIGSWLIKPGNTKKLLAEKLGISVGTLNNRISGGYEWTWGEACKLADVLGCSLSEFR